MKFDDHSGFRLDQRGQMATVVMVEQHSFIRPALETGVQEKFKGFTCALLIDQDVEIANGAKSWLGIRVKAEERTL